MYMKLGKLGVILALVLSLAGCGSDTTTEDENALPKVSAVVAEATVENASEAMDTVIEGSSGGTVLTSSILNVDFDEAAVQMSLAQQVAGYMQTGAQTEHVTVECPYGGTVTGAVTPSSKRIFGRLFFNQCQEEDGYMDGSVRVIITPSEEHFEQMTLEFPSDFLTSGAEQNITIHKGSFNTVIFDSLDFEEEVSGTVKSSFWFSWDSINRRYDDIVIEFAGTETTGTRCYKEGRLYIWNVSRYLDIDTNYGCYDPFTWEEGTLVSGSTRLIGDNDEVVNIEVVGDDNVSITAQGITIYVDASYE